MTKVSNCAKLVQISHIYLEFNFQLACWLSFQCRYTCLAQSRSCEIRWVQWSIHHARIIPGYEAHWKRMSRWMYSTSIFLQYTELYPYPYPYRYLETWYQPFSTTPNSTPAVTLRHLLLPLPLPLLPPSLTHIIFNLVFRNNVTYPYP